MERQPLRILHLENDALDSELIEAALARGGIDCSLRRIETRPEFETALRSDRLDLILSDYTLPAFSGPAALALARELRPETPFILVSGTIGEEAAIETLVGGATDYVLKHRLARLAPAVRRALSEAENRQARQQAEGERRSSEARYYRLFESTKDGLLLLEGATGRVIDANSALLGLLDWEREQVVGRPLAELDLAGGDRVCEQALREVLAGGETHHPDLRVRGRDRTQVEVDFSSTSFESGGQRIVQCSVRDLRERRKLERQLRISQKLDAVGQLAGGVAHDFNNILVIINSYAELALDSLRPEDPLRADLAQIKEAGERAASLTRQLLSFSSRQHRKPVIVSLNTVVAGLEQMLRRLLGEDLRLETRLAEDLGCVRTDPAQLEQVLMNLVINARDAMPGGGALCIATSNTELDAEYQRTHPEVVPGPYVLLAVADTGCGMDHETQARIFEPFFSTKGPGKGTGLGLATVYGIVKQSGGHIGVYSEPGHGSTFRVYLPLVQGDAESAAPEQRETPAGGSETVLVVEDDESIRRLALRVLEPAGYTVICAPSGRDALLLAGERPPQLLVTDVVLPDIDGGALAASFHDRYPGVRVLFMSGYLDEAIVRHGAPSTGQDFIPKPFTAAEFLRRVREALDRGQLDAANRGQPGA
jgi:hypothetical protein